MQETIGVEIMGWRSCMRFFLRFAGVALALSTRLWVPIFTSDPIASSVTTSYILIVSPAFLCMAGLVLYFASQVGCNEVANSSANNKVYSSRYCGLDCG